MVVYFRNASIQNAFHRHIEFYILLATLKKKTHNIQQRASHRKASKDFAPLP